MKKRPDGLYQKSIRLPSGKRKVFYARTQSELNRKILSYQYEAEQGRTFAEVADQWQEHHAEGVRYKTAETYKTPCDRARAFFSDFRVKDISTPDCVAFVRKIEAMGLSQRTVQLHRDVLSMILDYAIGTGKELQTNPCRVSLSPGLKKGKRGLPSRQDVEAIKAHRNDDRFSLLPFLLMYTGLRLGEALALRREDFTDEISVTKKVTFHQNNPVVDQFTKTERGVRSVPILDPLKKSLPEWEGYLFGGEKPMTRSAFRKAWDRYVQRTGVQCDRHSLRHEFVTLMYEAGLDAPDAAQITGHDVSVMQGIYLHITEERRQKSIEKLNEFVANRQ